MKTKIVLFGVSNVGKTTIGKVLADKLGYSFYDTDYEVMMRLGLTIEKFIKSMSHVKRDEVRRRIMNEILLRDEDLVMAVTPLTYTGDLNTELDAPGIVPIELYDTPYHIFQRLIFSDENDNIYTDDAYKNKHKTRYMREIGEDLKYYGAINASLGAVRFNINIDSPEKAAERIIEEFSLKAGQTT